MNYFGDEWGADGGWGAQDAHVADAAPPKSQQAPIGHETTKKSPITQPAQTSHTKAPADPTHYEPPQTQPASGSGFNYFDGDDDWGDSDLTGAMSSTYTTIIPDTTQPPQTQPEPVEATKEEPVQVQEDIVEKAPEPVVEAPKREARAPKTTAQAERSAEIMGASSMGGWGKKNIQNLAQKAPAVTKRRNNRQKQPGPRKAPISSQTAAVTQSVVATQPSPVGPSKHQVQTDPSSVSQDDLVQSLMEKVRVLEMKVEELENRQIHQLGDVCTLNSTGKTNHDLSIIWDSTNHIIRPQKGLKLVEPEKVFLEVSHRGLYQITLTTCGTNPQLIINGHVYAAARSALARTKGISATSCVNIYLYLDERATIAGRVTDEIASENPCEHWMCVRLVHQGF